MPDKSRPHEHLADGPGSVHSETRAAKAALRRHIRTILAKIPPSDRAEASNRATTLLSQQPSWKQAQSVLFYAPMPEELDIWPLLPQALEQGKTVLLPRYVSQTNSYVICPIAHPTKDLQMGQFGIREPAPHCETLKMYRLDLVLVPGVAYDLHGRRLGRGRGFYDQLLKAVFGKTCGIAFNEQIVESVPVEPHDIFLNSILTPTRWVDV